MGTLVYPFTLTAGANENVNDLNGNLAAIATVLNGNVDATNLLNNSITADKLVTALAQQLGLTNVANTGRGKTNIATSESRSNVAYGTLTTPDQVTGIVLPTDGLIVVAYHATWQESVNNAARAAVFVGANQVQVANDDVAAPQAQEAAINSGGTAVDKPLGTINGLLRTNTTNITGYTGDVTTGQIIGRNQNSVGGGPMYIFAAAGTYTVSVQFKASSGSVTAKNRHLWVWTIGF